MNFANRLKQLRKEYNLTQEELAQKISKTRSTIAGYETERKEPDYETLVLLADFFNVNSDYLLGRTDIRNPYNKNEEELTPEEIELLETIKNDPDLSILFHDLKSAPKKKIKQLLKTWNFVNEQFEEMEKELEELEKQKNNLHDLLERGIYDVNTYLERSQILAERIDNTKISIENTSKHIELEEKRINAQKDIIPKVEKVLDLYPKTQNAEKKNKLLKSVLDYAVYKKDKEQRNDEFTLILYPKLPR